MSNLLVLSTEDIEPKISTSGERRLEGDPQFTIWGAENAADGSVVSGTWEASPGKWRAVYEDKWEFCVLLFGKLIITEDGDEPVTLLPGHSFILRDGFKGTWEAPVTSRKHYVVHFLNRGRA